MTFTIAGPTEAELLTWIRTHINDLWSPDAVTQLLAQYDFAEKNSPSRNSFSKVAMAMVAAGPNDTPWGATTPEQVAKNLTGQFTITYKPVTATVDLPMPVIVERHQCPFCRRFTRAKRERVEDHMPGCFHNPGLRCCKTCTHHQEASRDVGHYCIPGQTCGCNDWDESCTHPAGPEEEYSFPVLNCPLWQAKEA
ncbi:hypothetical protein [Streptomyces sp. AS02]|uniref:hypothetical protein n=1 Tax=Streptomyces sp. AS02 TaxID=2938946 RepID=UPI0020219C23|nr:hypothetical protein [Streptomyces sp. AS02]MCL8016888.1 hypothetical protein [Streptomyces sp. AS02]